MNENICPRCKTNQRGKYLDHDADGNEVQCVVWTCKSRQIGNLFMQSKFCEYEEKLASLKAQLAELDCRHFALRGKLFQLAAACRAPCQVSGNWAASEIEKLLN